MAMVERASPPAALAELKAFLRLEGGEEDALLAGFLGAATETVEAMLGVLLIEREVEERTLARGGAAPLRTEPVRSLVSVSVVGADGSLTALAPGDARLLPDSGDAARLECPGLPEGTLLLVRMRAGMSADWNLIPEILRLCVVRAAAHFHGHRDAPDDSGIPPAVARMLAPWRVRRMK